MFAIIRRRLTSIYQPGGKNAQKTLFGWIEK
jgi:hypothetical protein